MAKQLVTLHFYNENSNFTFKDFFQNIAQGISRARKILPQW